MDRTQDVDTLADGTVASAAPMKLYWFSFCAKDSAQV